MKCHICSCQTDSVRSVMLRPWSAKFESWGVTKAPPSPETPAYEEYCKNMTYRRAFICEKCYQTIDANPGGLAEIPGLGEWNLAGNSRAGAAAVYDRAKWEGFQRSKAKSMGIEW